MTKKVLDVGNCAFDHSSIRTLVEKNFPANVAQAHGQAEALAALREERFDLVLVNRKLDRDGREGMDLLRAIKGDQQLAHLPVMLITNFAEHQQAAIDAGAEPGFGKQALSDPDTLHRLGRILNDDATEAHAG